MSELDTVIKNAEEIAIQEDEEIIEEVIEEEQVPWLGPTDVMEGQGEYYQSEELLEHEMVEYEDAEPYQSFLPIRDGAPYFSLNLPDLLSKAHQITQDTGVIVRLTSCFNKKCQRQVACGGCLYTIKDYVSDIQWNNWTCINPQCFGEIRTTPDFRDIREVHGHTANCPPPDEIQIAVRIAVYDTRLLAEFTDTPLENLYFGAVERLKIDCADGFVLFPPFEVVKSTLEDHRHNKIYRKRFEMQNLRDKQRKMNMTPDEVVFAENTSGMIRFRRTKPFPMSICNVCGEEISSTNLPSQDQLISHYMYTHGRRMTIERYEFKDVNTFEQYLRELNSMGKYKFKRMGLADENMFYLCSHDDRLNKTGIGRATRLQQQSCHCTAFIRVFDWRIVSKREGATVTIDYCLEHQQHGYDLEPRHFGPRSATNSRGLPVAKDYVDYYTPEQYIREIDERRHRTQKLNDEVAAERLSIKRPVEVKNYVPPGRLRSLFGTRALAPPLAAQLAAGNTHPYVDVYAVDPLPRQSRQKFRQPIRTAYPKAQEQAPAAAAAPTSIEQSEPAGTSRQTETETEDLSIPPPRIYITQKPFTRLTERQNFKDIYTFNAVCKVEDMCMSLLNRLQDCQNPRVALGYREKIAAIVRKSTTDPGLCDEKSVEEIEKSWVLQKPIRGRPRKRVKLENGQEDGGGDLDEDDDVVMDDYEDGEENGDKKITASRRSESPKPASSSSEPPPPSTTEEASTSLADELPRVTREESTSSNTSGHVAGDVTTRSGRARKPPARLLDD